MTTHKISNKNSSKLLLIISSLVALFTIAACASKPAPVNEVSADEPIVVASDETIEPYEPPPAEYIEPYEPPAAEPVMEEQITDMAMTEESSGIAPPDDEPMMMGDSMAAEPASSIAETPADYYGIQIVAASNMENLQAFATQHGISDQLSTKIVVDGKEWYVLLQGTYPTLEEAKAALDGLQGQYTTSPWIRRIDSLQ